jgi:hypothetical protein
MIETEAMTINERRKYIYEMWGCYRGAPKGEKAKLLDELEAVTGMRHNRRHWRNLDRSVFRH